MSYCVKCQIVYNFGHICEENPIETNIPALIEAGEIQKCFNCKEYIAKGLGCLHMTCICGSEFCYKCGGEYPGSGEVCACGWAH